MRTTIVVIASILLAGCSSDHSGDTRVVQPSTKYPAGVSSSSHFDTSKVPTQAQKGLHGVAPGL